MSDSTVINGNRDMTHRQFVKLKVYKVLVDSFFEQAMLSPSPGFDKQEMLSVALDVMSKQLQGLDWEWISDEEEQEGDNLTWLANCAYDTVPLMLEKLLQKD
jgi:hypothetical protein